jgi:hypothetical protein
VEFKDFIGLCGSRPGKVANIWLIVTIIDRLAALLHHEREDNLLFLDCKPGDWRNSGLDRPIAHTLDALK